MDSRKWFTRLRTQCRGLSFIASAFMVCFCGNTGCLAVDLGPAVLQTVRGSGGSYATATLKKLLDYGANPNVVDSSGDTALAIAARKNNIGCLKLLIDHGATPNSRDKEGRTPLHYASRSQQVPQMAQILIDHGADVHARDKNYDTPLHYAARSMYCTKVVKILVDHGADINAQSVSGMTPVMESISWSSLASLKYMLTHGKANLSLRDKKYGRTAMDWASSMSPEAVTILLEHGGAR